MGGIRRLTGFWPNRAWAYRKGWVSIGGSVFDKALRLTAKESFSIDGPLSDWIDALLVTASASPHSGWPFKDDYLEELPSWDGVSRLHRPIP